MNWVEEDSSYYYFNDDGTMATGWKKDGYGVWYYFLSSGKAAQGWKKVDGKWYYFYNDGEMAAGTTVYDEAADKTYVFGDDGVLGSGWVGIKKSVYDPSTDSFITVKQWWYTNKDGSLFTGWKKDGSGNWYYLDESCPSTGWDKIDGVWYYFDKTGKMLKNCWVKGGTYTALDGSTYTYWIYRDKDGLDFTGWVKRDGGWYYVSEGEAYTYGINSIDGVNYAFDKDGKMVTGWFKWYTIDGAHDDPYFVWYYFDSNGHGHNGWKKDGSGNSFYFDNGMPYRDGWYTIQGTMYYFDETGLWIKDPM